MKYFRQVPFLTKTNEQKKKNELQNRIVNCKRKKKWERDKANISKSQRNLKTQNK